MPEWTSALLNKLSHFQALDEAEREALGLLLGERLNFPAGTDLYREGENVTTAYIVMEGWAYRYKDLADGSRQIITFLLTGDFAGLTSMLSGQPMADGVKTLTRCTVVQWNVPQWESLLEARPRIGLAILKVLLDEQERLSRHLVDVGRRSAERRVARFLCELGLRLDRLGLLHGNRFSCPISQADMADTLGFSVVHINRTLRQFRSRRLIGTRNRWIEVTDFQSLTRLATADGDDIVH